MFDRIKTWLRNYSGSDKFPYIRFFGSLILFFGFNSYLFQKFLSVEKTNTLVLYASLLSISLVVIITRWSLNNWLVHKARLVDRSYVYSILAKAESIEPTVAKDDEKLRPINYDFKKSHVDNLKEKLNLKLNDNKIKEWDLLPLQNSLVDFIPANELIGTALLLLDELEDYADDTTYSIDRIQYDVQRRQVLQAIDIIHDAQASRDDKKKILDEDDKVFIEDQSEKLRAAVRAIQEYTTDYLENWSKGSVTLSGLKFCCAIGIPIFLTAGLLPITRIDNANFYALEWFNWSFIASSGALTGVLLTFLNTNEIEVGHAISRREILRAIIAFVLGFATGAIFYALFGSEITNKILSSSVIPDISSASNNNIFLSITWAFISGFAFEKFLNKVKSTFEE